jgi:hypothetical protein
MGSRQLENENWWFKGFDTTLTCRRCGYGVTAFVPHDPWKEIQLLLEMRDAHDRDIHGDD